MKNCFLKLTFKKYLISFVLALLLSHGFLAYHCLRVSAINLPGASLDAEQVGEGLGILFGGLVNLIGKGDVLGSVGQMVSFAISTEVSEYLTPIEINATDGSGAVGYYYNAVEENTRAVMLMGLDGVPQPLSSSVWNQIVSVRISNFCFSDDFSISANITPVEGSTWLEGDYIKCTAYYTERGGHNCACFNYSILNESDYATTRYFDISFVNEKNGSSYLFQGLNAISTISVSGTGETIRSAPGFTIGTQYNRGQDAITYYSILPKSEFTDFIYPGYASQGKFCCIDFISDDSNITVGKNLKGTQNMVLPPGNITQNDYDSYNDYIANTYTQYITNNYPDQITQILPPSDYYPREEDEPATGDTSDPTYGINYPTMLPLPSFPTLEMPEVNTSVFGQITSAVGFYFSNFSSLVDAFDLRWLISIIITLTIVIMILGR